MPIHPGIGGVDKPAVKTALVLALLVAPYQDNGAAGRVECKGKAPYAPGCIEPQFFAEFLSLLEIDAAEFGGQMDKREHAAQHARLEALFKTKTRDEWAAVFDGSDACTSPVLDYTEAAEHPQNKARGGLEQHGPFVHPRPAPVFGGDYDFPDPVLPAINGGRAEITDLLGYDDARVASLLSSKILTE